MAGVRPAAPDWKDAGALSLAVAGFVAGLETKVAGEGLDKRRIESMSSREPAQALFCCNRLPFCFSGLQGFGDPGDRFAGENGVAPRLWGSCRGGSAHGFSAHPNSKEMHR
jgi:hypothetical protein